MLKLKRIRISDDFEKMLKIHFNNDYEVGGVIFAKRDLFNIYLETLSFKKGFPISISFNEEDIQLFEVPKGNIIMGTWHTHPFQEKVQASNIDFYQWKKWNKKYIHLIFNGKQIKIYTSKGEVIYDAKIKKDINKNTI